MKIVVAPEKSLNETYMKIVPTWVGTIDKLAARRQVSRNRA